MLRFLSIFCLLGVVFHLSACTPVGVAAGGAATLGVAAASEGGVQGAITDTAIRLQIHDLWFKHSISLYSRVDMTVREGRVLVTGTVSNPDDRVDAIRLAWQADGVTQVINEIRVEDSKGFKNYIQDAWITTQLRTKITFDKEVQSINYTIDTVKGTVYLMGVGQDDFERERVINHARNIPYVQNVVSYVRLRGETPEGVQNPTGLKVPEAER